MDTPVDPQGSWLMEPGLWTPTRTSDPDLTGPRAKPLKSSTKTPKFGPPPRTTTFDRLSSGGQVLAFGRG